MCVHKKNKSSLLVFESNQRKSSESHLSDRERWASRIFSWIQGHTKVHYQEKCHLLMLPTSRLMNFRILSKATLAEEVLEAEVHTSEPKAWTFSLMQWWGLSRSCWFLASY